MSKHPELIVHAISEQMSKPFVLDNHYAGLMPAVVTAVFGLFVDKVLRGVCLFGLPVKPGMTIFKKGFAMSYHWYELQRLSVATDVQNASSFLVSQSLKKLPTPSAIVSFADCNVGHVGYIYQATNWLYTGLGGASKVLVDVSGNEIHVRAQGHKSSTTKESFKRLKLTSRKLLGKHRYVIFTGDRREKKLMRKNLRYDVLPYPKGDTTRHKVRGPEYVEMTF